MPTDPREVRPGDPVSASAWNAMRKELRALGAPSGDGVDVRGGAGGLQFRVEAHREVDLRLTGPCNAQGGYPWVLVYQREDGTWAEYDGIGGTADDGPAYARSGATGLDAGDRVYHAERADGSGAWVFDSCEDTPDGRKVRVLVPPATRRGNSLILPVAKLGFVNCLPVLSSDGEYTIALCCNSSSSSSSSGECGCGCKKSEKMAGRWTLTVDGFTNGGVFPCPCFLGNGSYTLFFNDQFTDCLGQGSGGVDDSGFATLIVRDAYGGDVSLTIVPDQAGACGGAVYVPHGRFHCCAENTLYFDHFVGGLQQCETWPDTVSLTPAGPCVCGS